MMVDATGRIPVGPGHDDDGGDTAATFDESHSQGLLPLAGHTGNAMPMLECTLALPVVDAPTGATGLVNGTTRTWTRRNGRPVVKVSTLLSRRWVTAVWPILVVAIVVLVGLFHAPSPIISKFKFASVASHPDGAEDDGSELPWDSSNSARPSNSRLSLSRRIHTAAPATAGVPVGVRVTAAVLENDDDGSAALRPLPAEHYYHSRRPPPPPPATIGSADGDTGDVGRTLPLSLWYDISLTELFSRIGSYLHDLHNVEGGETSAVGDSGRFREGASAWKRQHHLRRLPARHSASTPLLQLPPPTANNRTAVAGDAGESRDSRWGRTGRESSIRATSRLDDDDDDDGDKEKEDDEGRTMDPYRGDRSVSMRSHHSSRFHEEHRYHRDHRWSPGAVTGSTAASKATTTMSESRRRRLQTTPVTCTPGQYFDSAANSCEACGRGRYSAKGAVTRWECSECPPRHLLRRASRGHLQPLPRSHE
eukprot:GHVU01172401.1.p1 GENE.GHVU01172401.1~~GHVU01172401.1.p1  ORF type:complete len:479 (+),score=42.96 GHVU01172401.1:440-1876(+)